MKGLMELLGARQESPEILGAVARLRVQARVAEARMKCYESQPGYRVMRHWERVRRHHAAPGGHQYPAEQIFTSFDVGGWNALKYADDMLGSHEPETST